MIELNLAHGIIQRRTDVGLESRGVFDDVWWIRYVSGFGGIGSMNFNNFVKIRGWIINI